MHTYPSKKPCIPLGKDGEKTKFLTYIFGSVLGSFFKGTQPTLHSSSGSLNWLTFGNQLSGWDSLFVCCGLDFCLLHLKIFCLYGSSKNLVGFLSNPLLETQWCLANATDYVSQIILIVALTLLSIMVTIPTLPLAIGWHHLALPLQNPIIPFAVIFTTMSGLRRGAITELFRDAGASLTNLFCKALLKGISSDAPSVEE